MYSVCDSLYVPLCVGAGIDDFVIVLEIFCSWYVYFMGTWEGFWDWKGWLPRLVLVDVKSPEDFLLRRGHSFTVVPVSSVGIFASWRWNKLLQRIFVRLGVVTLFFMWVQLNVDTQIKFGGNAVYEGGFHALFRKELAFPSCWLNCCTKEASSVTWRVDRRWWTAVCCLSCSSDHITHLSCQ